MATATATAVEMLAQEISTLETQLSDLRRKRATEQETLAALTAESGTIAQAVAKGTAKPSAVSEHNRKLEQSKAMIEGLDALISVPQRRLDEIYPQMRRQRAAETERAELEGIAALGQEAQAIVERIAETLGTTARGDLKRYEEIRKRLMTFASQQRIGVFPVPLPAQAAHEAIGAADKTIKEKLAPILKLWQ